eukprot:1087766-Rhodomonas_salina.1
MAHRHQPVQLLSTERAYRATRLLGESGTEVGYGGTRVGSTERVCAVAESVGEAGREEEGAEEARGACGLERARAQREGSQSTGEEG